MVTADKSYDSKKNHRLLRRKKKKSAIIIKKNRKSKRLKKNQIKVEVQAAQRERPKIERKFAELKRSHGLAIARYWGLTKMAIQNLMAAITCNLKMVVKLILQRNGKSFIPIETLPGITVPI
jgi:IS5 family transposase